MGRPNIKSSAPAGSLKRQALRRRREQDIGAKAGAETASRSGLQILRSHLRRAITKQED